MSGMSLSEIEVAIERLSRLKEELGSDKHAVVDEAADLVEQLRAENARLLEQVKWLAGKPFRRKDESVPPGQLALDLLEMLKGKLHDESDDQDSPDEEAEVVDSPTTKSKRKRRPRELRVEVVDCHVPESERLCECCETPKKEMGFDAQRRIIHVPTTAYILEERRYKYSCKRCEDGVQQAEPKLPAKPIPGSMASSSLLAFIIVSKVLDGLPIHRTAKILARHGVDLSTSTLNEWFAKTADLFTLIHQRLLAQLRECELISLDDTPLKAQSRGHPNGVIVGRQWLYIGNKSEVLYAEYTPDWKGLHPRRVLDGYGGDVQNDGYAGINPLFTGPGAPRRVGCNDHSRRKFVAALEQGDARAQAVIDIYRPIYAIERRATEAGMSAAERLVLRQRETLPLWERLEAEIARLAPQAGKKSPLGKAVTYFQRQLPCLKAFLDDGFLPISNAHVEQQIRTVALMRKNSLFVGSVEAGQRFAVLLTVLLNCQLVGANPYDYLVDVIDRIASGHPASRLDDLLPRRWLELRQSEEQSSSHAATS